MYWLKNIATVSTLIFLDLIAFSVSFVLAFQTRRFVDVIFPQIIPFNLALSHFFQFWWIPLIFISFFAYEKLYVKRLPFWDETKELIKAVTISIVVVLSIVTLGKLTEKISRLTMTFLWIYGLFLFPMFRLFGKNILYKSGLWRENVIIIGAGRAGTETARGIISQRHLGYNVIGFLDDADEKIGSKVDIDGGKYKVFGKIRNFGKFVNLLNISTVIVATPSLRAEKMTEITNNIQRYTKNILLIPDLKGIALTNTELYYLFMQQLFVIQVKNNLKSVFNRLAKRIFDIVISILLMPFILATTGIVGILIKICSPGPIFYSHPRVGRNGKTINIYKFRTMYRDAKERLEKILCSDPDAKKEWETFFKLKNDPRVTRIGNFLRKTSLDELPQIFNVLKGEMSLVGPRPVVEKEIKDYYKRYADYYFMVTPGITGLWQVSGRNDTDYDFRINLDKWYVLNWSLWLDIVILFKTIKVVFKREGAY